MHLAVLSASGALIGSQLYGPYGSNRYSNGTLPTSIGFTGQRYDSVSGLNYYNARYYDPNVGVFISADTVQGNAQGVNPYGYVGGNQETWTDPTGHEINSGNGGLDTTEQYSTEYSLRRIGQIIQQYLDRFAPTQPMKDPEDDIPTEEMTLPRNGPVAHADDAPTYDPECDRPTEKMPSVKPKPDPNKTQQNQKQTMQSSPRYTPLYTPSHTLVYVQPSTSTGGDVSTTVINEQSPKNESVRSTSTSSDSGGGIGCLIGEL